MTMLVQRPGLLSTFQDLGRWGHQHLGVSVTGAMDTLAHRVANLIVGNHDQDVATLEMTLAGPTLKFDADCCICVTGADMKARCDDRLITPYRPFIVRRGQTIRTSMAREGARAYLAVHGGFDLPRVMDSESTYLRAGLGGWQGRALQKDDVIGLRRPLRHDVKALDCLEETLQKTHIYLPAPLAQFVSKRSRLRILRDDAWDTFTRRAQEFLIHARWRISPDSERMGYRLEGPRLRMIKPTQLISEAAAFGTIQVPGGGQPIILMADRQTTGGYPKIATVATVDLPALAQKRPGEHIQFVLMRHARAQILDQQREQAFARLTETSAQINDIIERECAKIET